VAHQQALQFIVVLGPEQHSDRLPFARYDNGAGLGCLHVFRKVGGDFTLACDFHSSISFPAIKSRLPSFTPTAWI
jgi:hypothetical protein